MPDKTIAVAAVEVEGRFNSPEWPWRVAFIDVPEPADPMTVQLEAVGRVEGIDYYDRDGAEAAVSLRCRAATVWLWCAGGDFVQAAAGQQPPEFDPLRVSRRLPR